jgi:hypothetical protein
MVEAQQRAMQMERHESKVVAKRRRIIPNIITLLDKGIKIPDINQFMWTQTKHSDDKHVEHMENWKDIAEEEVSASKARIIPLFMMDW